MSSSKYPNSAKSLLKKSRRNYRFIANSSYWPLSPSVVICAFWTPDIETSGLQALLSRLAGEDMGVRGVKIALERSYATPLFPLANALHRT